MFRKAQVGAVSFKFRIGIFTHDHHRHVRTGDSLAIRGDIDRRLRAYGLLERLKDGRSAGRYVARLTLPFDGPATTLHTQIVSATAGHVNSLGRFGERQDGACVLEQYHRLTHCLTGYRSMFGRTELIHQLRIHGRLPLRIQQAHGSFNAQDSSDRIVDPRHGNGTFVDQRLQVFNEGLVVAGHHHHVHPCVDGDAHGVLVVFGNLIDGVVVRYQEPFEPQFTLEHISQQILVGRHLETVPTAVRRHDRHATGSNGRQVGRQMNLS